MNAITKALTPEISVGRISYLPLTLTSLMLFVVFVAVLLSAIGVVYAKDLNRRAVIDYQMEQQSGEVLASDNANLLLEESTLANQARIQVLAQRQLAMKSPAAKEIVVIKTA